MKVESIRNRVDVERMEHALKYISFREYMIFKTGINTALRCGDLLSLKVHQVKRRLLGIHEQKTGKFRRLYINEQFMPILADYIKYMNDDDYLFRTIRNNDEPNYWTFYKNIKKAADYCNLEINIGTHTLRKTFGFWHYQTFKDIAVLMNILNHSKERETLIYIGVIQEEIDKTMEVFFI